MGVNGDNLLEVRKVSQVYSASKKRFLAIQDIDLSVQAGEFVVEQGGGDAAAGRPVAVLPACVAAGASCGSAGPLLDVAVATHGEQTLPAAHRPPPAPQRLSSTGRGSCTPGQ